ncbi:Gustatory receptor 81f [Halyomorpha halys]|nr:Gustatory receptor 81f [Halyomorpha halys]
MYDNSIIKSSHFVFNISKRFGLFPFTINNGYIQVSWPLIVLLFIINLSTAVITTINFSSIMLVYSSLSALVCCSTIFFHNFYPFLSVAEYLYKLKDLNESISKLQLVRSLVFPDCTSTFQNSKTYLITSIVFIAFISVVDFYLYLFDTTNLKIYILFFLNYAHVMIVVILIDRFSGFVGIVTSLFRKCNDEMLLFQSMTATFRKKLEKLAWAHDQLCHCATIISEIHSFQIFLMINICLFINVFESYMFFGLINHEPYGMISSLCWFGLYCGITWRIVDVCELCKTEAKKFNTLLYQLMIDDKTNEISENKKLRLHISMKREVVFSACGFFNLDYTLIHSMVAAATTYLVILIQFGQPMNNEVPPEHLNATLTTSSEVSNFFTTPSWIYTTI